jgi:hypothetical protein
MVGRVDSIRRPHEYLPWDHVDQQSLYKSYWWLFESIADRFLGRSGARGAQPVSVSNLQLRLLNLKHRIPKPLRLFLHLLKSSRCHLNLNVRR